MEKRLPLHIGAVAIEKGALHAIKTLFVAKIKRRSLLEYILIERETEREYACERERERERERQRIRLFCG